MEFQGSHLNVLYLYDFLMSSGNYFQFLGPKVNQCSQIMNLNFPKISLFCDKDKVDYNLQEFIGTLAERK